MKHFEPLMTHLSPLRVAVVFIPETSEPASGSVRQNEASRGASDSRPRYSFFRSSEAASAIGAVARPLHDSEVPMPEQPHAISSSISALSRYPSPGPPYSAGRWLFISPSCQALAMMSWGEAPSLSYSHATGGISF